MRVAVDGFVPSMEEGNAGVSGDLFHCLTFWDPGSIPYLSDGLSRIPLTLARVPCLVKPATNTISKFAKRVTKNCALSASFADETFGVFFN